MMRYIIKMAITSMSRTLKLNIHLVSLSYYVITGYSNGVDEI